MRLTEASYRLPKNNSRQKKKKKINQPPDSRMGKTSKKIIGVMLMPTGLATVKRLKWSQEGKIPSITERERKQKLRERGCGRSGLGAPKVDH